MSDCGEEEEDGAESPCLSMKRNWSKGEMPDFSKEPGPSDTKTNMASKNYVLENAVIHKGPPVRYQLIPTKSKLYGEKEEGSKLRRWTLGKKDPNKPNKTILLVGETGSGKSTLVNALLNYVMGVKAEDREWFEVVQETKKKPGESQTSKVRVYEIFGLEGETVPYSLTIIDTPGYGDTRGIEHDAIIIQSLQDLFRSEGGIHEIDAVGLVLKASLNQLSERQRYIFNAVTSLFGKNMEENIVALITHSDGFPPTDALEALDAANVKCAKNKKNQPVHFLFNNCQTTEITEDNEFGLQQAWMITTRGMKQFADFLEQTKPQKLETTVSVLNERVRLAACINNLSDRLELIDVKQKEIQQTEKLEKHKEQNKTGESFMVEVDEPYKEKEPIDGGMWFSWYFGAVTCNICEENCHYPGCTLAWYPEHCEVMKGGRCTSCTRKCPASDHVKKKFKYVTKTRKVKKTSDELKKKYEIDKKQFEDVLSNLQKEKEKLEKEKDALLEEAYQHVVSLDHIALNVDSLFTHVHLDFLIKKMKEKGDTEKVQKLEEMTSRVDEGIRAVMKYAFSSAAGKVTSSAKHLFKSQ